MQLRVVFVLPLIMPLILIFIFILPSPLLAGPTLVVILAPVLCLYLLGVVPL